MAFGRGLCNTSAHRIGGARKVQGILLITQALCENSSGILHSKLDDSAYKAQDISLHNPLHTSVTISILGGCQCQSAFGCVDMSST